MPKARNESRICKENQQDFIHKIPTFERIRYFQTPNPKDPIYQECAKGAKIIIREKPSLNGRFEWLYYHNEKSLSISYHRYGNLGIRALKNFKESL